MNFKRISSEGSLLGFCSSYLTAAPEFSGFLQRGGLVSPELLLLLGFSFTGKWTVKGMFWCIHELQAIQGLLKIKLCWVFSVQPSKSWHSKNCFSPGSIFKSQSQKIFLTSRLRFWTTFGESWHLARKTT